MVNMLNSESGLALARVIVLCSHLARFWTHLQLKGKIYIIFGDV